MSRLEEIEKERAKFEALPFAKEEELELVADLAIKQLYKVFGAKGGRRVGFAVSWAAMSGYRIPEENESEFRKIFEAKWKLLINYLNQRY